MISVFLDLDNKGIGQHIFDGWYSYRQALTENNSRPPINFVDDKNADIKIKVSYMPEHLIDSDEYDMICICNGGEPYSVSSPLIKEMLQDPKVFMITNAYHPVDMHLGRKNIWYPEDVPKFQRYCTDGRYPQFYETLKKFSSLHRKSNLIFVNGQNRSWRHHFFTKLSNRNLGIQCHSALGSLPIKTLDSQWESPEDTEFRDYVNDLYTLDKIEEIYYSNSIAVGINQKLGSIPPGYFLLPYYFENACVIFPETDWQNDFLVITEKALKCFYAGCLPFPIGGSNVNKFYNEVGFFTAWNLLPDGFKLFDSVRDHDRRYNMAIDAIKWMKYNPEIWHNDEFDMMTRSNLEKFLTCSPMYKSVSMFDQTMTEILKI